MIIITLLLIFIIYIMGIKTVIINSINYIRMVMVKTSQVYKNLTEVLENFVKIHQNDEKTTENFQKITLFFDAIDAVASKILSVIEYNLFLKQKDEILGNFLVKFIKNEVKND